VNWNRLPDYTDIAIIGAGPHSLTLMTYLLQKRAKLRSRVMIFDPSGEWLSSWHNQLAAQEIPHLRSPAVHHPDPNPFSLRKFAENRPSELFPPYDLPGTKLFEDFCHDLIRCNQLEKAVVKDTVTRIMPKNGSFELDLGSGATIFARRVVLATNGGIPNLPNWVTKIQPPTLVHSSQVDLRGLKLTGERILIVGGGLTSGHLAVGAIGKGATVDLMARRVLQEKLFDADPGWLGPKYLKGFQAETCWEKRFTMIKEARNGGSMTPAIMLKLRRLTREGKLKLEENCQVESVHWQSGQWQVKCENGQIYYYHRIWLATGSQFQAENHPLLGDIWEKYQTPIIQGLPVLDEYLRVKGTELFMMGGLAALRLGPTARNLSGAIKASQLITEALVKPSLAVI
jgi:cation diffusion facilitator CzcD-associated flavoprotein CzcO